MRQKSNHRLMSVYFLFAIMATNCIQIPLAKATIELCQKTIQQFRESIGANNYKLADDLYAGTQGIKEQQDCEESLTLDDMRMYAEAFYCLKKIDTAKIYLEDTIYNSEGFIDKYSEGDVTAKRISSIKEALSENKIPPIKCIDNLQNSLYEIKEALQAFKTPLSNNSLNLFQSKIIDPLLMVLEKNDYVY
ncbi:MAG: hypothetical protein HQK52_13585 [Oligoflexia bacterium]|nr:hypothetical protein [Oligoflexia bacterium]